jgi:spermidine synthase
MTDVPSLPPISVEPNIPLAVPPGPAQGCESFADPVLGLALLLFFGSGCAALIYEVVWLQLLQLLVGSDAIAIGVLLATYMGGLCLGSLILPRLVSTRRHPLRVYAVLELLVGIFGLAIVFGLPSADRLAATQFAGRLSGISFRAMLAAVVLLPPTFLMGATLPALSRWVRATPSGVAWMGYFYGGNIVGAVAGSLLAGFYLLPRWNMVAATVVAAIINIAVFTGAMLLASSSPFTPLPPIKRDRSSSLFHNRGSILVMFAIALSGMTALGGEAVWTRILALSLGGTVYTFSIILAVFLLGLGIGTSAASSMTERGRHPRAALAICQGGLILAIFWAAWATCSSMPDWPIDLSLNSQLSVVFPLDVMRCLWAILPAAILWGASFPFALAAVASPGQDTGRSVGAVYAANTLGAIAGAVFFSIWVVPHFGNHEPLGTQMAHRLMMCLATAAAVLSLIAAFLASSGDSDDGLYLTMNFPRVAALVGIVFVAALLPLLARNTPAIPQNLIAFGRQIHSSIHGGENVVYAAEGINSSVAVSSSGSNRYFHVSGKTEASTDAADMRLQRMLGHIPSLLHKGDPHSVLIVGCGAGVTAGTFTIYPTINQIDLCELEPLIPPLADKYFHTENYGVVQMDAGGKPVNPRVNPINFDDARHYMLTTSRTYDIITSDPIHPWVKGSAILYTREYFQLCKDHLNPGGIVTQWVPLYESNIDAVRCELRTFFDVFPDGIVWGNDNGGTGYDMVVMGRAAPDDTIDPDAISARLDTPEYLRVKASMAETGFGAGAGDPAFDLMLTYAGRGRDLRSWLTTGDHPADLNTDDNLRLQYLAGWSLDANPNDADTIYKAMLFYRRFPEDLISTSKQTHDRLKQIMFPPSPIQRMFPPIP